MILFSKRVDRHKNHIYKHTKGLSFPEEFSGTGKPCDKVLKGLQNCLGEVSKQKNLPRRKYGNFHEEHFLIRSILSLLFSLLFQILPSGIGSWLWARTHLKIPNKGWYMCVHIYWYKLPLLHSNMEMVRTILCVEGVMSSI